MTAGSLAVGPDCREGKHRACDGRGFDLVADQVIDCACSCHRPGVVEPAPAAEVTEPTGNAKLIAELKRRADFPSDVPDRAFLVGIRHLMSEAAAALEAAERDERIVAWERIVEHPVFRSCFNEERPLLVSMLDRLAGLESAEAERDRLRQALAGIATVHVSEVFNDCVEDGEPFPCRTAKVLAWAAEPLPEPPLAIDGHPVCACPGDDPRWRERVGHEPYCPRRNA